jgi:hypothetical protein
MASGGLLVERAVYNLQVSKHQHTKLYSERQASSYLLHLPQRNALQDAEEWLNRDASIAGSLNRRDDICLIQTGCSLRCLLFGEPVKED